jgi:hypothetical protein
MAKVTVRTSGCWEWTGAHTKTGHGHINIAGRYRGVHVVMYEIKVGPVPDGMELDHLCRNPPCCNPDHLEPVTHLVNVDRGQSPMIVAHLAGTCTKGHSLAEEACYRKGTNRVVYCRACRRDKRAHDRVRPAEVGD